MNANLQTFTGVFRCMLESTKTFTAKANEAYLSQLRIGLRE